VPVDTVHVAAARLTRTDVARLAGPMHRVLAFTVNEREQGQRLRDWGVTAIFSDHPERFSGLGT
jgi:glycerophosphoryl diester phosphodiesterase